MTGTNADARPSDTFSSLVRDFRIPHGDSNEFNRAFTEIIDKGSSFNSSVIYDLLNFAHKSAIIRKYMNNTVPGYTLEIGPGKSLGQEILFCLSGVREAFTLDPHPLLDFDLEIFMKALRKLLWCMDLLRYLYSFPAAPLVIPECHALSDHEYRIGNGTVKHFPDRSFENTGFEDQSFDVLFSTACLEHVTDPLKSIKEASRILRPGGLTIHQIDLRDHRDFGAPLRFLTESRDSWEETMIKCCFGKAHCYMNRWRASQFKEAFKSNGFEILEFVPDIMADKETIVNEMPGFAEDFRRFSLEDLRILSVFIVAKKR